MKFVVVREEEKVVRYICPECGATILTKKKGENVELPNQCKHCGIDLFLKGEDED